MALIGVVGCSNTLSGLNKDVNNDTSKAVVAAGNVTDKTVAESKNAAQEIKTMSDSAGSDAGATLEIKTAIVRDPVLNNSDNVIHVKAGDHVARLVGHVASHDMVVRATEDARVAIASSYPGYQVSNELSVSNSGT